MRKLLAAIPGVIFLALVVYMMVVAHNYEGRREGELSNYYKAVPINGCDHLYAIDRSLDWFKCMGVEHVGSTNNQ